jgi:proline racemase
MIYIFFIMIEKISTVEMHTGGEPLRIIISGFPDVIGDSILEKRAYVRDNLDQYRRFLMFEPRGHKDMYGALLVKPKHPEADIGVLFMHNEGYSTMCGHAIIALGRYLVDQGIVLATPIETKVAIECPCGLVTAWVETSETGSGAVRFETVPAFVLEKNTFVETPNFGPVELDIAYGGAFYAFVDAATVGLDVKSSRIIDLVTAATEISDAVKQQKIIAHPAEPELGYLYGTILTDGQPSDGELPSANICVFAEGQVDRSPTGSGVTARMALAHVKQGAQVGDIHHFESITGAVFNASILAETIVGKHTAVTAEVSGRAHYSGTAEFSMEQDDMLAGGFLLK